uniref:G_PROTEIN_RECEP_F1_2 domain-containing protein n=1 Tax=Thelazia callipaeda TaxID=103827 RepID=A0A0N5D9T9_THECL
LRNILSAKNTTILISVVIIGNILVILSVIIYQRMRTFTNKLLMSLATADLLVGFFVMPLSLLDLLLDHAWPFDMLLCKVWSTSDVLFCTASILNLCVISIDRYLAITNPLKYSRTRNRKTAALLLGSVWLISFVVCSPPLIFHIDDYAIVIPSKDTSYTSSSCLQTIVCGYPNGLIYRIYSSMASFFIPLLLMCSIYYKIFCVVSKREKMLRKNVNLVSYKTSRESLKTIYFYFLIYNLYSQKFLGKLFLCIQNRLSADDGAVITLAKQCYFKLQPRCFLARTHVPYHTCGPGKFSRHSREKILYIKERKALKTIAILFFAFTICWLPFFLLYLFELLLSHSNALISVTKEVFLWLGYSNSVLNPIIYTMYNNDFRRCFRDLITFGFLKQRRSMSIRKLHQQNNC